MTDAPATEAATTKTLITKVLINEAQLALSTKMHLSLVWHSVLLGSQTRDENAATKALPSNNWRDPTLKTLLLSEPIFRTQFIPAILKRSIEARMAYLTSPIQSIE